MLCLHSEHIKTITTMYDGVYYPDLALACHTQALVQLCEHKSEKSKKNPQAKAIFHDIENIIELAGKPLSHVAREVAKQVIAHQNLSNRIKELLPAQQLILQTSQLIAKIKATACLSNTDQTKICHALAAIEKICTTWISAFATGQASIRQRMMQAPREDEFLLVALDLTAYKMRGDEYRKLIFKEESSYGQAERFLHPVKKINNPVGENLFVKFGDCQLDSVKEAMFALLGELIFPDVPIATPISLIAVLPFAKVGKRFEIDSKQIRFLQISDEVPGVSLETVVTWIDALTFFKKSGYDTAPVEWIFNNLHTQSAHIGEDTSLELVDKQKLTHSLLTLFKGKGIPESELTKIIEQPGNVSHQGLIGIASMITLLQKFPKIIDTQLETNILMFFRRLNSYLYEIEKLKQYYPELNAKECIERCHTMLTLVDETQISALSAITSILINSDGKFDNYNVMLRQNLSRTTSIHVVGFDNNQITERPLLETIEDKLYCNLRFSLFLLPWGSYKIDPFVLQQLQAVKPHFVMTHFLQEIAKLQHAFTLFGQTLGLRQEIDFAMVDFPIEFCPWFLAYLERALMSMRRVTQEMTNLQMCALLHPAIVKHYRQIIEGADTSYMSQQDNLFDATLNCPVITMAETAELLPVGVDLQAELVIAPIAKQDSETRVPFNDMVASFLNDLFAKSDSETVSYELRQHLKMLAEFCGIPVDAAKTAVASRRRLSSGDVLSRASSADNDTIDIPMLSLPSSMSTSNVTSSVSGSSALSSDRRPSTGRSRDILISSPSRQLSAGRRSSTPLLWSAGVTDAEQPGLALSRSSSAQSTPGRDEPPSLTASPHRHSQLKSSSSRKK